MADEQDGAEAQGAGELDAGTVEDTAEVTSTGDEGTDPGEVQDEAQGGEGATEEGVADPKGGTKESNPWTGVAWRHRQAAERAGLTPEIAAQIGPEALEKLAGGQDDLSARYAEIGRSLTGQPPKQEAVPGKAAPKQEPPAEPSEGDFAINLDGYELDDEYQQRVVSPIVNRINEQNRQMAELRQIIQPMQALIQETEAKRAMGIIDSFLSRSDVAENYASIYGEGDSTSVGKEQLKARGELFQDANAIFLGARQIGRPISEQEALERALLIRHKDQIQEQARRRVMTQVDKRNKQASARPTGRRAPSEAPSEKKAIGTAGRLLQKLRGMS